MKTPHRPAVDVSPESLRRLDADHVWHPFTPMSAHAAEDVPVITAAQGFYLTDAAGRQYLDGVSSLWCNVHGHRVPEIDQAIEDQLGKVAHSTLLGLSGETSILLAERLARVTPAGLNRVFYSDAGATAVEAALKIAYQYHRQKPVPEPERTLFLTVGGAYHGDTIGSVSVGAMPLFHQTYGSLLFETVSVPSPGQFPRPEGVSPGEWHDHCLRALESAFEEHGPRLAAMVLEPLVQGAAGIWTHPAGYLSRARELTREYGTLLVCDEVAVGFGRTGTLFACEQEQVEPDLMCVAKGLTGGYLPLAATLTTDTVYEAFLGAPHEMRTFFHGHTFTGNPLGCAAALASLDLFESNDVLGNSVEVSATLSKRFTHLAEHPHVGDVRQKGTMVGIELCCSRDPYESWPAERRTGHRVTLAARERGAVVRPLGDVVVLMPAPAMPVSLVEQLCDVTLESIDVACRG